MIITVGGIKGGSGKTTIATNLAVMRSLEGGDVLLVDADDQETASDFTLLRNEKRGDAGYSCVKLTGPAVRTEVLRLEGKYRDIIIDTGGRDTTSQRAALTVSDVFLVPFVPRSFDVWTLEKVGTLLEEMRTANPELQAFAFLNRADHRGADNDEAADALQDAPGISFLPCGIGARKAFANAAALGCSVVEMRPRDSRAVGEICALYASLFSTPLSQTRELVEV